MLQQPIRCRLTIAHGDFVMQNHRVHDVSVMPGVTFLDVVWRILQARGIDPAGVAIRDVLFTRAVATADGLDQQVRVLVDPVPGGDGGAASLVVESRPVQAGSEGGDAGGPWVRNLVARLMEDRPPRLPARLDVEALKARADAVRDMAEIYEQARAEDIRHGAAMRAFGRLHVVGDELLAELDLDPSTRGHDGSFHVHPALLDASTLVAFARTPLLDAPFIPMSIDRVGVWRPVRGRAYVHVPQVETLAPSGDVMHNDYRIYDADGRPVAAFTRLTCKRIRHAGLITALVAQAGPEADEQPTEGVVDASVVDRLIDRIRAMVADELGVAAQEVDIADGFYEQGLDSVAMLRIGEALEGVVGAPLYPTLLFEFGNVEALAQHLADTHGVAEPDTPTRGNDPPRNEVEAIAHPGGGALPQEASQVGYCLGRTRVSTHVRTWTRSPWSPGEPDGGIVILAIDEEVGAAAATALRDRGHRVALTTPGPELERAAHGAYRVPFERVPLGELFDLIAEQGLDPRAIGIVATDAVVTDDDPYAAHDLLCAVASALVTRRPTGPTRLCFVASGHAGVVQPEHAALGALARTISAETSVLRCRGVTVEDPLDTERLADLVVSEVLDAGDHHEVRHRDGHREVPELQPLALTDDRPVPLRRNGVYLISGGGGGIGRQLAAHLIEQYDARLVLVGRSPADEDQERQLAAWRSVGAQVTYVQVDVVDPDGAQAAAEQARLRHGRLDGVFHLAGVVDDGVFFRKDVERSARVLAPKLRGARNLDLATADDELELFALFSSISAVRPNPGQADYAYANAFLDSFAAQRAAAGRRGVSVSIGWPYWAEGGMRAGDDEEDALPSDEAFAVLPRLLAAGEPHVVVTYGEAIGAGSLRYEAMRTGPRSPLPRNVESRSPLPRQEDELVAIVGVAGRYPQAGDLDELWRNLVEGRDCVTEVPADRWDHDTIFDDRKGHPGTTYGRSGGFVDGVDRFAPGFFNISRRTAERMDPQERLFLQTCWQALEDAGHPPETLEATERVGVFAGVMWSHYQLLRDDDGVAPTALHSSVPNRVSYTFDLTGPSLAVDTACSSSLVAIHLAVESIRRGESTMALAGGVNVTVHPQKYLQLADDQFLSEDGRCRAFGAGGTGYVPGEGVGVVVLKPLHRALADGDRVEAVIRATAVNHNGRTAGYTVPEPAAQAELIAEAIHRAGVPPETISYVEAHGTGTALGDPIEIEGLARVFGETGNRRRCAVGSIKSNIGHLESAAGIAGVTKVLLQLRHGELVPSLHTEQLNENLDLSSSPLVVQRERAPWRPPADGIPLRAGVSAFGAGGANAHVVLERFEPSAAMDTRHDTGPQLVPVSAPDMDLLRTHADLLATRLSAPAAPPLADVAHTLRVGRRALPARLALVVQDADELCAALRRFADGEEPGTVGWSGVVSGEARPDEAALEEMLAAGRLDEVARRWVAGAAVDWSALPTRGRRVSLPTTPLPEERCWLGAWARREAATPAPEVAPPSDPTGLPAVESFPPRPVAGVEANGDPVSLRVLDGGIAVVTMQDHAGRNMLTDALLGSLQDTFAAIAARDDVNVVVLTGTEQVFCMGGTPEALQELAAKERTFTDAAFVYEGLLRCPKPVVAAMRGHASGGGLAFGLYADVVVMSLDGVYSANFLRYGFTPGMGATHILEHRFGPALANEMLLTGRGYRGDELVRRGGQVRVEPADDVLATALELARSMASLPAESLRALKAELAGPLLERLPSIVEREVALHDQVLGEAAVVRVRESFATAGEPAQQAAVHPNGGNGGNDGADGERPDAAGPDRAAVVDVLERSLCAQLYLEPHEIDHERPFSEMGLDSIGAVEVVRDVNRAFGTDLDSVTVYDHPTVTRLSGFVLDTIAQHQAMVAAAIQPDPPQPATEPAPLHHVNSVGASRHHIGRQGGVGWRVGVLTPKTGARTVEATAPRRTVTLEPTGWEDEPATEPDPALTSEREPDARPEPRLTDELDPTDEDRIAVVGMAGRFPDADDLDTFWDNLASGRCSIREVPPDRWDARADDHARWAALLSDVEGFDHRFFGMSPLEAEALDPQQRLFLTEAYRALEDAGYAGETVARTRCGVFVGCATGDYIRVLDQAGQLDSAHAFLGSSGSILAARIAYLLDLRGPTVAVDTACSSSLVAVHLACQSLRSGESDLALAGGVAVMLTPSLHLRSGRVGMLSPTGTCAPFDATADGIVLGEGVGVVVLKRLGDALRDGDHIHGLVEASGTNGDGRTNGITAPSAASQVELLRRVHRDAGIQPGDLTYVEAHGTGTALGDPIEFKALTEVLSEAGTPPGSCGLGSVKGNVGHTTMTAGIAGLLKVLLSLQHRELPPSAGFRQPNPEIDVTASPMHLLPERRPWDPGPSGRRLAAVSSFGFSGTNCHVVVGEPPARRPRDAHRRDEVVVVSARTDAELDMQLTYLADALSPDANLTDVAFTLATGRRHLPARAAVVARDIEELRTTLRGLVAGRAGSRARRGTAEPAHADEPPQPIDADTLDGAVAAFVTGRRLDWTAWFDGRSPRRLPLPTYPFTEERHSVRPDPAVQSASEPTRGDGARLGEAEATAPGLRTPLPRESGEGIELQPGHPLVVDHQIGGAPLLPGAASVALVTEALRSRGHGLPLRFSRVRWRRPFDVDGPTFLAVTVEPSGTGFEYTLGDPDQPHATGAVERLGAATQPQMVDLDAIEARCRRQLDVTELYAAFDAAGMRYGPSFRLLDTVSVGDDEVVARLRQPVGESTRGTSVQLAEAEAMASGPRTSSPRESVDGPHRLGVGGDTAVLDAGFQAIAALLDLDDPTPMLPVGARAVDVHGPLVDTAHVLVRRSGEQRYDVDLCDAAGQVLAHVDSLMLRPGDPLAGKVFVPVWREVGASAEQGAAARSPRRVAVLCRTGGFALAEALLGRLDATEAVLLPFGPDQEPDLGVLSKGYDSIWFLGLAGGGDHEPEHDPGAPLLLRIVRTLVDAGRDTDDLTLRVVTDGAVATGPDEVVRPHTAALVGLTQTIAAEHPGWHVGCVDVGVDDTRPDQLAVALVAEDPAERLVALRPGRRLVRTFESALLPAPVGSPFRQRGVYLLVGGVGGIGFELSLHLARTSQARLAWIGRRAEDDEIRQRMRSVADEGGEVVYLQADVARADELARAIDQARRRFGAIHGAFHVAGVMHDRLLRNLERHDLERVQAPKVAGSINLCRALAGESLDVLVFFSSAASFVDSVGQANYAAASTFEDAWALHARRSLGLPATVINWGYWGSVGAVADDYHRGLLQADGVGSIEPRLAMLALERVLAARSEQVLVVEASPQGLAHFGVGAAKVPPPRSRPRFRGSDPQNGGEDEGGGGRHNAVAYVRGIFAEVLKHPPEELDRRATFEHFGVDSVVGAQIIERMERDLGPLPSTLLFEENTIDRLANRFVHDHASVPTARGDGGRSHALEAIEVVDRPPSPQARTSDHHRLGSDADDVAVIGVSGRYPGASDLDAFWRNLRNGVSSIGEVPAERWDWRSLADPRKGLRDYQRWGGFLDDVDLFDAGLFGILPRDAVDIDPQERLFLETCWNLLEQTGYAGELSHEPHTGVFVGLMYGTYGELGAVASATGELSGAHSAYWSIANRVSYTFDFDGPSLAVDSACSSSLTAVHLACEAIRRGDCRTAIVGGVNLVLHPAHFLSLGARNMLASDGAVKVFAAAADGYVPGEGVGAVLLKPLADALRDGDSVWAVVKGSAVNAGGRTSGYTVPNPNAQAALVEEAVHRSGVDPAAITYVEAHGSGTELGDPIEVAALAGAFRSLDGQDQGPSTAALCSIGSVKSNIGHLEGAAGIAGLTKVLLQMRHGELVPTINLDRLNPKIRFDGTSLAPQRELAPWPEPRIAGVSSFGAGGANAHVVVEAFDAPGRTTGDGPDGKQLVVLSAPEKERLEEHVAAVAAFVESGAVDVTLAELAYTSQVGRRAFPHRLAVVAGSLAELAAALRGTWPDGRVVTGTARVLEDDGVDDAVDRRDLDALAQLWVGGAEVDWRRLWSDPAPRRVAFPTLPLRHRRFWLTPPGSLVPGAPASGLSAGDRLPARSPADGNGSAEPTMSTGSTRLEYERIRWLPDPLDPAARHELRTALLVGADESVTRAMVERLDRQGIAVVDGSADEPPDALIHLTSDRLDPVDPAGNPDGPFRELFARVTDLLRRQPRRPLRAVCGCVVDGAVEQPHVMALAGLLKTLAQEHNCNGTVVALGSSAADVVAERVVDELTRGNEPEVAYDRGARLVKRPEVFEPPTPRTDWASPDGAYLVTGGAGALGLHVAELLVRRGAGEVVLVGRSDLHGARADKVDALGRSASAVRYLSADVSDPGDVERLMQELGRGDRPLRGVIHAAGVIRDCLAVNKTDAQIAEVLAPKLHGVLHLDRATADQPLDLFVVFSSIVGQTGNRGQADYAYANAFLDAFVETRERWRAQGRRHGRSLSIGWPLWADGGMTVDAATAAALKRRWGMVPMSTASGLRAFESLLAGPEAAVGVVEKAVDSAVAGTNEVVADVAAQPAAPVTSAAGVGTTSPPADRGPVLDRLRELAAGFLLVDPLEVEVDAELLDLGFDSISLTDLVDRINESFDLDILPTVLFECPTLTALADHLLEHVPESSCELDGVPEPRIQLTERDDVAARTAVRTGDVAVVGMAGRMPGSADLDEFWRHLAAGHHLVRHVPEDREELLADPRTRHMVGGFLDGVAEFDAEQFGIAPREAALMDPQQRLFLEAVWQAVGDAGYRAADLAGSPTGLFVGVSTHDYEDLLTLSGVPTEAHMATGLAHAVLANRVSFLLDLRGPSEAVDTACSSSLVALHRAVRALRSGECDAAVVGGVGLTLTPGLFVAFAESGMLSPRGRCQTFGADADGYVRGEGVGAVLLKPLARALADRDHIYGVVKGSAVNHCGRTSSLTAPNPRAQADVLLAAYRDAEVDLAGISYLEAHGTGTRLGDPVEIEGIKAAFDRGGASVRPGTVTVGSVKTNVGHLEAAAGIAGLLKVLLAMRHGQIPAHLHVDDLNPYIRLDGSPLVVGDGARPWPETPLRRAGVSSFGFGGTNAHVVLEDGLPWRASAPATSARGPLVLVLSAPDAARLADYAHRLAARLEGEPAIDLRQVAWTLQVGRDAFPERLAVVADDDVGVPAVAARLRAAVQRDAAPQPGVHRATARSGNRRHSQEPEAMTAAPGPSLPPDRPTFSHRLGSDHADMLAAAWVDGADLDWAAFWSESPGRVPLPAMPLARAHHWFSALSSNGARAAAELNERDGTFHGVAASQPVMVVTRPGASPGSDDRGQTGGSPERVPTGESTGQERASSSGTARLRETVRGHLAQLLDMPAASITDDRPFEQLGLDSIFAMDLAERLTRELGQEVEASLVFESETLGRLVEHLAVAERPVASRGDEGSGPETDVSTASDEPWRGNEDRPTALRGNAGRPPAPIASKREEPAPIASPEDAVRGFVEVVVGQPIDPGRTFEDGISSIDMLRTVSELEEQLGPLPKTLLFDQPDIGALTRHLVDVFGADAVASLQLDEAGTSGPSGPDGAAGARRVDPLADVEAAGEVLTLASGAVVVSKRRLGVHPELAETVRRLDEGHGVESGLAGRDIAPLVFVGSARSGYLELARDDRCLLAWSYTGAPEAYEQVVAELVAQAGEWGLTPNLLSPAPIAEVAGAPFTATPFGVVQQIDDLSAFSLGGGSMRRLRGLLNRFAKEGDCEVVEHTPGSDPAVDAAVVGLIDAWAGHKATTVNPYVATVRADVQRGQLPAAHRMFLTRLDGELVAAVVMTRMPVDDGWLLDVEFYRGDMPLGGLEHTIVEIIGMLRDEGARVFSFGVTFGVRAGDSPNPSLAAEQALEELAAAGMTGAGNYQFKRKFRPTELPVYLCQPADDPTDVAEIMLMIASPTEPAPLHHVNSVGDSRRHTGRQGGVGWRVDVDTSRTGAGTQDEWNVLRLPADSIDVDLLSDSWVERDDPWITERIAQLLADSATASDAIDQPWLPFDVVVPTSRGRTAEALLCRSWPTGDGRRRRVVLHNGLFPTFLGHLAEARFTPVALAHDPDAIEGGAFAGDVPLAALDEALDRQGDEIAFVVVEPGANSGGGRPTSLANLRAVRRRLDERGLRLVLDATRLLDDAIAIVGHEPGQQGRDPWDVAHDILALADAATLSLSKDFGVNFGGLVASRWTDLDVRLREVTVRGGTEVSLTHRRLLQHALGDRDAVLQAIRARGDAVAGLAGGLAGAGLPIVAPTGGHCVLLDVSRLAGTDGFDHPVEAALAWIHRHTGIRGGPHLGGSGARPELDHCIRLAVPVGMSRETIELVGDRLAGLVASGGHPVDLVRTDGGDRGPQDATYAPAESEPSGPDPRTKPAWFRQQLRELGDTLQSDGYDPANQNLAVLREHHPGIECRMVEDRDGQVEVFLAGSESSPELVLMHPFNIGAAMFAPQIAGLSDRYRIVAVHQPGVGRTRTDSELSLEGLSRLQRRVLATVGIEGPVHVGGASVGSIFAEYFTLRYPDFVRSLSLMGGSYRFANRKGQIDKLDQVVAEDFDMIESGTGRPAEGRERVTELLLRCESMDPRTGLRYIDLFAKEPDLTPRLHEISVPTLVIQGAHDSVVGVKTGHFLHGAIPDARYVELPSSGHFVCFTEPDRVNDELRTFLGAPPS